MNPGMSSEMSLSDAPLATFEIDEFCEEFAEFQVAGVKSGTSGASHVLTSANDNDVDATLPSSKTTPPVSSSSSSQASEVDNRPANASASGSALVDNFNENFSGSLEDLVSTFDEKITKCFNKKI